MVKSQQFDYSDDNIHLKGYYSTPDNNKRKMPAILICHDWSGKNEFAHHKADQLAELGYVGFALDMYGDGKLGNTKEEKSALIAPLMQNRKLLEKRIMAAYQAIKTIEQVDSTRIGAMGFCFGGLCVLDLARSGADVKGVVSFHGLLLAPENYKPHPIKAKILALHGYDDPMVKPDQVMAFADEMTQSHADWQIDMYGSTMHAFTNPDANDPDFGTVYDKKADARSWLAMQAFFNEVLK